MDNPIAKNAQATAPYEGFTIGRSDMFFDFIMTANRREQSLLSPKLDPARLLEPVVAGSAKRGEVFNDNEKNSSSAANVVEISSRFTADAAERVFGTPNGFNSRINPFKFFFAG